MTDWHEWRRQGIGASDIANAYSGAYGGAYAVVADKLGRLPAKASTTQMERGHRWEQTIADAVHQLTGFHVVGEQTWCEHPDQPRHRCTVDGLLAPTGEATIDDVIGVLEVKTVGRGRPMSWSSWEIQTLWQMHVTGLRRALIAAAEIDDTDDTLRRLELRWVDHDPLELEAVLRIADHLLEHIDTETLPTPDGTALDTVAAVHRDADPDAETVDLDDLDDMCETHIDLGRRIDSLQAERDDLAAVIRDRMGAATVGRTGRHRVSVSRPLRILTDDGERALLAEHPELGRVVVDKAAARAAGIYESFLAPVGSRRLTIAPHTKKEKP